jgi:hypothetical protein
MNTFPFLCSAFTALLILCNNASACCAVARPGQHVVNADQSVIIIWDESTQTQHFIRKASFTSNSPGVGFIVPLPSRPSLAESGAAAFPRLATITAPPPPSAPSIPFACAATPASYSVANGVQVLESKRVAGFDATVLTADSGTSLATWLSSHGFTLNPDVAAWAAPYIRDHWCFAAMKIAKPLPSESQLDAAPLRLSFQTSRPLFPYREPASTSAAASLGKSSRLLRLYVIASRAHKGTLGDHLPWSGLPVWSGDISPHRSSLLTDLNLPDSTLPGRWWLTEFEDRWPYASAPGDLWFSPAPHNVRIRRTTPPPPLDLALPAAALATGALRLRRSARRPR